MGVGGVRRRRGRGRYRWEEGSEYCSEGGGLYLGVSVQNMIVRGSKSGILWNASLRWVVSGMVPYSDAWPLRCGGIASREGRIGRCASITCSLASPAERSSASHSPCISLLVSLVHHRALRECQSHEAPPRTPLTHLNPFGHMAVCSGPTSPPAPRQSPSWYHSWCTS